MPHNNKKGVVLIFYILFLAALVAAVWSLLIYNSKIRNISYVGQKIKNIAQTDSSEIKAKEKFKNDPFFNITLPYLRNRQYSSKFEKRAKFDENDDYTSYIATYDSDGLKINGYLTVPKSTKPASGYPGIVFVHGYIPPSIYKTTENYVKYVDYFAKNGYVVFKPDLRGHDQSEGEALGAYFSGDYIVDVLNAYSAMQNFDLVNSRSVGLWGHSMGGNVTFRSFVAKQDIPALVIWSGAVYTYDDMQEFGIQDNSYRPPIDQSERQKYRQRLSDAHGSFISDDEFWQTVVPTNYLENVAGAIQINHAIDDVVVNIGYSQNLGNILSTYQNINFELKTYPVGGHNIVSPSYEYAMENSLEFFDSLLR